MRGALISVLALLAGQAAAQTDLRPTPDYFAAAIFDLSMAQALARSCSAVSVEPMRAGERSQSLMQSLVADGFSTDAPHAEMETPEAAIAALQEAFVARHKLSEPDEARICEIALIEIAEASGIGQLMVEVAE